MNNTNLLIDNSLDFYNIELKRHNDASHPINILTFLLDNDLIDNDKKKEINQKIIDNSFHINMNIPVSFGGTGENIKTWIMCDYPLTVYLSIRLNDNTITESHKKAIGEIVGKIESNGWRCTNKGNIGKFRGPGRKEDECPIATLNVLKLLTLTNKNEYIDAKQKAVETILNLWQDKKMRKPYLFGMGTDFKKIKYPMIWYDILNVINVLSFYSFAIKKAQFHEMYSIIDAKMKNSNFTPESVYQFWKGYDFGQKKLPSIYIEKTVREIEERIRLTTAST